MKYTFNASEEPMPIVDLAGNNGTALSNGKASNDRTHKHIDTIAVNPEEIVLAHRGWHPDSIFWNARDTFGDLAFQELREDIKSNGLSQEITLRTYTPLLGDKLQVVCGERRLRVIRDLLAENCDCYDRKTRTWKKAREIYSPFIVKVEYECDDQLAIKLSYGENRARDDISDYDNMQYCYELRELKRDGKPLYDLQGIGELLNRSMTWVSQSLSFLALPDRARDMLKNGELTRSAALYCLKIDRTFIGQYLDFVVDTIAQKKHEEQSKFESMISSLQDQLEINSAQTAVSTKQGKDTTKLNRAKEQLKSQLCDAKQKKKKIIAPRLTPNDMQAIANKLKRGRKGKSIVMSHKEIREMRNELMGSLDNYRNKQLAIHIFNLCLGESEENHIVRILEKYVE